MNLKFKFAALAALMLLSIGMASAAPQTDAEKKAQKAIVEYLRTKGYSPSIDSQSGSIDFKSDNTLYWITISEDKAPLLYTLNTKGLKFSGTPSEVANKKERAEIATNKLNASSNIKSYVDKDQVMFCFPMYAETPEAFCEVIKKSVNDFAKVKDHFMEFYKAAGTIVKERHNYWYNLDTMSVVIEQNETATTPSQPKLEITDFKIRVVDRNGAEISGYNQGIRKNDIKYVQEEVTVLPDDKGSYALLVKIYDPQGRMMVPYQGASFTTYKSFTVDKKGKEMILELNKFGSDDGKVWSPGEYKIEFCGPDGNVILANSFNVL